MQVLDIKIPKYVSSLISDNKTPNHIKTIRGKGILETRSNFSFEEKIILRFEVDEEKLRSLLKLQARFQTLILLPFFDEEISTKILDGYNLFRKNNEENFGENLNSEMDLNYEENSNSIDFIDGMLRLGFLDFPEHKDCFFGFLESISVKNLSDSLAGYEVELIIWTCSDLSYMKDDKEEFILEYYKAFKNKENIFKEIDKHIDSIFADKKDSISISFKNAYNEQDTYIEGKSVYIEEAPEDVFIDGKYITDVEIRTYNNLKRVPIQNKPKGFIQHLGKGEIAISLRLVLNEENARTTDIIHKLRAVALAEQKYISTSEADLFLLKAFDIKEIDLMNISLTEATDEVDATIVNLLFIGSCTNKTESDSDFLNPLSRSSTTVFLSGFEKMLDKAIEDPLKFKSLLIQSSDLSNESQGIEGDNNFNLVNLVNAYYDNNLNKIIAAEREKESLSLEFDDSSLPHFDFMTNDRIKRDIYAIDAVMYRFNQFSYYFLKNIKEIKKDESVSYAIDEEAVQTAIKKDTETKPQFIEKIYEFFLGHQFNMKMDMASMDLTIVHYMFELEIINNLLYFISEIILDSYKDEETIGVLSGNKFTNTEILKNGTFNQSIKKVISKSVNKIFKLSRKIIEGEEFLHKATTFYSMNLHNGDLEADNISAIQKSVEGARTKILERFDKIYDKDTGEVDSNYSSIIASAIKLCVVGSKNDGWTTENHLDIEIQSYIVSYCIASVFIPNLAFEKSDLGQMIKESSHSLIAPISLSAIALEEERGRILQEIFYTEEGEEFIDEESIEKINLIKRHINVLFGDDFYNQLLKFSVAYQRTNSKNSDFQRIFEIPVFSSFETPLDFFEKIINNTSTSKSVDENMQRILKKVNIPDSDLGNYGEEILNDASVKKMIDELDEDQRRIYDETINTKTPGNSSPAHFMNKMLLGQVKFRRSFAELSKLITADYKKMMPDFEIILIDEFKVEQALYESSYRNISDYYNLNNVYHISIKKNDVTNTKNAIIKITNTRAHYIDAVTYFKEIGFMSEGNNDTVIYDNKYVVERPEIRIGMLINISLDKSSQYFDFTGRIDSVDINANDIVIKCSSFASELLSKTTDINNFKKDGTMGMFSFNSWKSGLGRRLSMARSISASKSFNDPNTNLVPENEFAVDLNEGISFNLASSNSILFSGLGEVLDSVYHLNCPYNQLLSNERTLAKTEQFLRTNRITESIKSLLFQKEISKFTANRIAQNITNVDRDICFYGMDIRRGEYDYSQGPYGSYPSLKTTFNTSAFVCGEKKFGADIYSYQRKNVTLYEVLNDVTLRAPGTFWEVYESGNFGTLFFGRNNYRLKRKNKVSSLTTFEISKIFNYLFKNIKIDPEHGVSDYYDFYNILRSASKIYDGTLDSENKYTELVEEYIKVENKEDYEEVANKIYAVAGFNLISCNIQANNNCPNVISLEYDPTMSRKMKNWFSFTTGNSIKLKLFDNIPSSQERIKFIDPNEIPNIHTPKQAYEVAQSILYKELRNFYSGKIVILYNSNIRVNTEVAIMDSRNKIFGTVVVKDYEHILDSEMGLITIITPGMKTRTSSLMSDIYLVGLWQKINYELLRDSFLKNRSVYENKVTESTLEALKTNLLESLKHSEDIPIVMDNMGYDYKVTQVSEGENTYSSEVTGAKNQSSLPFKIYPLIKNGRPIMPDSDFYGKSSTPFHWITNIVLGFKYMFVDSILKEESRHYIMKNMKQIISDTFDLSDYKAIDKYMKMFTAFDNPNFINEIMKEDYEELLSNGVTDETAVKFDGYLAASNCYGFMNCAKLNITEKDRIKRIAKIMFHFETINLVELDGRMNAEPNSVNDFSFDIVEEIRKELEYYSKIYNKKCKEWTIITKERLLDSEPYRLSGNEWYDDIGAVIVNLPQETAMKYYKVKSPLLYSASVGVSGKEKKASRKAMIYTHVLRNNVQFKDLYDVYDTDICVLHNYYGGSMDSYELRRKMLVDLEKKFFVNSTNEQIMIGDFNLRLISGLNSYVEADNKNENYNVTGKSPLITSGYTTSGNKLYDNFIVKKLRKKGICSVFRYFNSSSRNYFKEDSDVYVSDHFPIFMIINDSEKNKVYEEMK